MFVVVATMTALACTEPDVFTQPPPPPGGNHQSSTQEFHSSVTTWQRTQNGSLTFFDGIISQTPVTDLTKAQLFWIRNGQRIAIETLMDVAPSQMYQQMYDGFIWASVRNNIFTVNYIAKTPNSTPPFPFEVIIVY